LGRTVQEAQATLTSTDFLKWIWFLDWKSTEEFRREDYYMAQIAAAVERGHVKKPSSITLQRMLLKFKSNNKMPSTMEGKLQNSKSFWLGITGLRGNKRNSKKRTLPKQKGKS
jgi:hypothetical protein